MQEKKYPIKFRAKDDRPREKLLYKGPESLSDSELLAILINNGNKEKSAIDLARNILRLGKNSLTELGKLNAKEFTKIKGIGEAKAITISAALELGRRRQEMQDIYKDSANSSDAIGRFLQSKPKDYQHEILAWYFKPRQ